MRGECARTCLDPQGRKFCGNPTPNEGCFCRDGFVRNSAGNCVPLDQCGCKNPDGSGLVAVGQTLVTRDCSKRVHCPGPQQVPTVENLKPCHRNAQCRGDQSNVPKCVCKNGFAGDGHTCVAG